MVYLERCRVCDATHNLQLISEEGNDTILCMLRTVTSSTIELNEYLPKHICLKCSDDLKEAYSFRSLYSANCAKMKKMLLSPNKEKNGAIILRKLIKRKRKKSTRNAEGHEDANLNVYNQEVILTDDVTEIKDHLDDKEISDEENETQSTKPGSSSNSEDNSYEYIERCESYKTKIDATDGKGAPRHEPINSQSNKVFKPEDGKNIRKASSNPSLNKMLLRKHRPSKKDNALNKNFSGHICNECGESLDNLRSLKAHEALHSKLFKSARSLREHKSGLTTCHECGKSFSRVGTLRHHLALHKNPDLYKCDKCGKSFRKANTLKQHAAVHSDINKCDECGKSFATLDILKVHLALHKKPDLYKCVKCRRSFQATEDLKAHEALHSEFNECDECGQLFSTIENLKLHIAWHQKPNPYKCNKCEKFFASIHSLQEHEFSHSKSSKCDECGKSFGTLRSFQEHFALHSNPDLFRCDICGKAFTQLGYFKRHMALHSNPDLYKCDKCDQSFKTAQSLKEHHFAHSDLSKCEESVKSLGSLPGFQEHFLTYVENRSLNQLNQLYKCDFCGKSFTHPYILKRHMVLHFNHDFYKCNKCGKVLSSAKSLERHKAEHSGSNEYD